MLYTDNMNPAPDPEQPQRDFRVTAELLERIRLQEIAALSDEEALRQIMSLSVPHPPWRERPDWSGLVELQALFHGRRKS